MVLLICPGETNHHLLNFFDRPRFVDDCIKPVFFNQPRGSGHSNDRRGFIQAGFQIIHYLVSGDARHLDISHDQTVPGRSDFFQPFLPNAVSV